MLSQSRWREIVVLSMAWLAVSLLERMHAYIFRYFVREGIIRKQLGHVHSARFLEAETIVILDDVADALNHM